MDFSDLLEVFSSDLKLIENNFSDDTTGYWKRSYVRTAVSMFEAEVYSLKNDLLSLERIGEIDLEPEQIPLLRGKKYDLNDQGILKEKYLQNNLTHEIRFVFALYCQKAACVQTHGYDDHRWSNLIETIRARNRLTHPKSIEEQQVSESEITACESAIDWFVGNASTFLKRYVELLNSNTNKTKVELEKLKHELQEAEKNT